MHLNSKTSPTSGTPMCPGLQGPQYYNNVTSFCFTTIGFLYITHTGQETLYEQIKYHV